MKAKNFRDMTNEELESKLKSLKQELFNLRFSNATGQLANPMQLNFVKKDIARIKTILTERELNKAKKKLKSQFACEVETVSEIGESIGYYMTVCDDLDLAEQYIPICESITAEDLKTVAKEFLNINNAVISILKPKSL